MAIGHYIKEIGRGKDGARALTREQAADLFRQILHGSVSDLEVGAFCIAMRIKGETSEEMCGFLDATQQGLRQVSTLPAQPAQPTQHERPAIVIPSYNGARKLPVLTPLLALLLARQGFAVVIHGSATEDRRVFAGDVLAALGIPASGPGAAVASGQVAFFPTEVLHPGLQRLLDVRRVLQLRNPAHSLVKLLLPCQGKQMLVTSYTHPEYALSMEAVLRKRQTTALLLRGTEGEAVADPRRLPRMQCLCHGISSALLEPQSGPLASLPQLPTDCSVDSTVRYIESVLQGQTPVPPPIAMQIERIVELALAI